MGIASLNTILRFSGRPPLPLAGEGWGEGALNLNAHSRRQLPFASKLAPTGKHPPADRAKPPSVPTSASRYPEIPGVLPSVSFFLCAGGRVATGLQLSLVLLDDSRCA